MHLAARPRRTPASSAARQVRRGLAVAVALTFGGCLDWDALYGARCGDGTISGDEACDDGNTTGGDGCGASCQRDGDVCGDGRRSGAEECDDANEERDDVCPSACRAARCGDGHVWASVEDCDDGNTDDGDACSSACRVADALCGNGSREVLEECDDGNRNAGDGCSATCRTEPAPELCGNARLDPDEACDDGDDANDDACLKGCSFAACGDGFVWRGAEQCDDGDTDNQDGCSRTCLACTHADGALFRTENGHCYKLYPGAATVTEAIAACEAAGSHLWTTTSAAEARDVNRNLVRSTEPFWLGYRTSPTPAGWLTGESTSFQAWAPGEPSDVNAACAVQVADASAGVSWRSAACGERHAFVCESEPAVLFAATHHAYRLSTRARVWTEARDACAAAGGHLVTLGTKPEHDFIASRFSIDVWLGATRGANHDFAWLDGEPLTYTAFGNGQPNDADGNEDCLVLTRFNAWNDIDCALERRFVCEFE